MIRKTMHMVTKNRFVQEVKRRSVNAICNNKGMELVQVAILVAIAIIIGLLFKDKIGEFVTEIFDTLSSGEFSAL